MNYLEIRKTKKDWLSELDDTPTYLKRKNKRVNNFINIITVGSLAFFIRPPLFLYPLLFIGFDVFCTFLNIFTYRVIPEIRFKCRNIKRLQRQNKRINKIIDRMSKLLSNNKLSSKKFEIYTEYLKYNKKRIERNNDKIEFIAIEEKNKAQKEEEKAREKAKEEEEKLSLDNIYKNIHQEKITQYDDVIKQLESYVNDQHNDNIDLSILVDAMRRLFNLLNQKPENINYLNSTFNVYGTELLNILKNIDKMPSKEQAQYNERIIELINEYVSYINGLEDKIQKDALFQTDVDINVLMSELRKAKERSQ